IDPDNEQTKSLLEGMQMVYRQLVEALKNEGVEPIEAVGKEFDPNLHQAVMQVEDENYDSNIVVEELQKGYKLKDRVIRPSMVKVNQ
ncbi:nucleotide exchange factor GrpE, partial [Bacillus safensis]